MSQTHEIALAPGSWFLASDATPVLLAQDGVGVPPPDSGPAPAEIGPTNPGPASDADPDALVDAGGEGAGYAYDPFADGVDPEADADGGGGGCSAPPAAPVPWLPTLALLGLVRRARRAWSSSGRHGTS